MGDEEWQCDLAYLQLLLLLEQANSLIYLYDAIVSWTNFTSNLCEKEFFDKKHPKRDVFWKVIEKT